MKQNVGSRDRIVRFVLAAAMLSLLFVVHGKLRWLGLLGLGPLFTGLVGYCPAYSLIGLNTCSVNKKD